MQLIYKLYCHRERKGYIGITGFDTYQERAEDAAQARFREHARENTLVGKALSRHGAEGFTYLILEICHTRQYAEILEHQYIIEHGTLDPNGYNKKP